MSVINIFFSEATGPVEAKFHMEPPWIGGKKVFSNNLDHMAKMAAMPIHGRYLSGTDWLMLKFGIQHRALEYYQVCSNDDPRLTFDLFMHR